MNRMLSEAQTRFQAVFENALDPIMLFDDATRYVDVNPAACKLLGYSRAELLQMTIADVSTESAGADVAKIFAHFVSEGKMDGVYRLVCKDGSIREVEFQAAANILPGLHLSVFHDVTERNLALEKFKTSAVLLAEAQRVAHFGSWNWDLLTGIVQWSDEHYRIFGLRPQEIDITYERYLTYVHPDDRPMVERSVRQALTDGHPFDNRFRAIHRDGTTRFVQSRGRIALDESGRPVRLYGTVLDITERQQAEDALRKFAERLHALSLRVVEIQEQERRHLAYELHDEIGQLLSAITVDLQAIKAASDVSLGERLDESIRLVEQMMQKVRNLSFDLRPSMLDDLGLISTLRWYADRQAQRAGFVLDFAAEISGDRLPAALEIACYRVVQEGLTNVVRHAFAKEVWLRFVAKEEEVELAIRDNGIGFDLQSALSQTSRGASFGVLGMKERVELLGGQFEITSKPGHGTSIRVFLPVCGTRT